MTKRKDIYLLLGSSEGDFMLPCENKPIRTARCRALLELASESNTHLPIWQRWQPQIGGRSPSLHFRLPDTRTGSRCGRESNRLENSRRLSAESDARIISAHHRTGLRWRSRGTWQECKTVRDRRTGVRLHTSCLCRVRRRD